jgi:AbrB family looped-hinge helix DNA binding protein
MDSATLTTKGQTTIPKRIRDHLGLAPGDEIRFFIRPDGSVLIMPTTPIQDLKGCLGPAPRKASLDEIDAGIKRMGARKGRPAPR